MLTVTTAAEDRTLLTLAEIRSAVGITDGSYTAELDALNDRVGAAITRACAVVGAGATLPTLRQEVLVETFRSVVCRRQLWLSRAPVVSIASVVVDGATLDADEYEADGWRLRRLYDDAEVEWSGTKITVSYTAGWSTVPDDLKLAASKLARILWTEDGPGARDPGLKREKTDGVDEREYWVAPSSDPLLSAEIAELLAPYINYGV